MFPSDEELTAVYKSILFFSKSLQACLRTKSCVAPILLSVGKTGSRNSFRNHSVPSFFAKVHLEKPAFLFFNGSRSSYPLMISLLSSKSRPPVYCLYNNQRFR